MKERSAFTFLIAALVAAILILYLISFQVRETEVAVLTTFGKLPEDARSLSPGLHWKWPWPVQEVNRFDRRLSVYEDILSEVQTRDGKPILVNCYVGWRITDAARFLKRVGNEKGAEEKIGKILRDQKGAVIGRHDFAELVSLRDPDRGIEPKFGEIESQVRDNVREKLGGLYGIDVAIVGIKRLELPATITAEVFNRMKNERKRLAEKYKAEGEKLAMEIRAKADKEKSNILSEAEANAKRRRGEADAAAAKYYEAFALNPELAVFLRELEALRKSLEKRATLVLSRKTAPFELLEGSAERLDKVTGKK